MSVIARQTTWASLQTLTASALNGEFNNIVNAWNNHDSGTSRWTVSDAATIKKTGVTTAPILQVVQATNSTAASTTSGTYQATNLTASITPNATSSHVLVMVSGSLSVNGTSLVNQVVMDINQAGSSLTSAGGFMAITPQVSGQNLDSPCTVSYYASPASVASTAYIVNIKSISASNTVTWGRGNIITVMTLIEFGT